LFSFVKILKKVAFLILGFVLVSKLHATVPTIQASNFIYNNLQCDGVNLQWTNGNGSSRIIVAKLGSKPDYVPVDGIVYNAAAKFGSKPKTYGTNNDNLIVYNSNSTNFVKIDSLLPCTTYYFTIYEHDNNGSSTKYLTTGAPTVSFTTYCVSLDFSVGYIDSCQINNKYEFKNASTSTIPGISYLFDFGDGDSSSASPVLHSYKTSGLISAKIKTVTNIKGCQNVFSKGVKVFQKKVVFIDFSFNDDTVQCFEGNLFYFKTGAYTNPLSGIYGYRWFTQFDTTDFSFFKKTIPVSGRFKVSLEVTTKVQYGSTVLLTPCKDTVYTYITVLPSPVGKMTLNDTFQCLKRQSFKFDNPNNTLVSFKWYFGDKDSSLTKSATHVYKDTGNYQVIHVAKDTNGCLGRDTIMVRVAPDAKSQFSGLDTFYCSSKQPVSLFHSLPAGRFYLYPTQGDALIPDQLGSHTLGYIAREGYCEDTSFAKFVVGKTPVPDLGADIAICSTNVHVLDANDTGRYLWNTGEITRTISVSKSGKYIVNLIQGKCSAKDSVNIVFATKPKLNLGSDTILCKGGSLKLNASSPTSTYKWNTGSTDSFVYAFSPGKYVVTVTNPCGVTQDSIYVNYQTDYCDLFMANAFTPGNDLVNNVFMPRGRNISVKSFQIFNRWGELIFETDMDNVGWDGTYKGDYVPDGLYIWRLNYWTNNGPYIKKSNAFGQILLIR